MTIEVRGNKNYAAQVIRVPEPFALPNADRLVGLGVFGYTVVTAKDGDIHAGTLAVFFPAEAQLSAELVKYANLYRHAELNADPSQTGYLEDNRRVRALKLRGTVSNGLLLPVHVVEGAVGLPDTHSLSEGDVFDTLNGVEVSRKYQVVVPAGGPDRSASKIAKAFKRVDAALFPVHIDTDQWLRNEQTVADHETLIVTQKLHGTSARFTRTLVRNELTWWERLAKRLGLRIEERSFDVLAGSRQVIKDPKSTSQVHHYGVDLWTAYLSRIENVIPSNVIVYGEIIGWVDGDKPIQKGHTYDLPVGERELYVYRVSVITDDGDLWDLSWDQVRHFCTTRGLKHVPELWRGPKRDFDLSQFEEKAFATERLFDNNDFPVPLSKGGTGKDEGIAIRVERGGQVPLLFKSKNPSFYLYETAQLDRGESDTESSN